MSIIMHKPAAFVSFSYKLFKPCKSILHIFTCKSSSSCSLPSFPVKSLPLRFRYYLRRAREKYLIRRIRRRRRRRGRIIRSFKFRVRSVRIRLPAARWPATLEKLGLSKRSKKRSRSLKRFKARLFWPCRRIPKGMDELGELRSLAESVRYREPFPSPLTPAYIKMAAARRLSSVDEVPDDESVDDVDEACRSFENYLAEVIVEDGMVRDLNDVEELLCCWESLKSPVFVDMVSRFYGELCSDLFSADTSVKLACEEYYDCE